MMIAAANLDGACMPTTDGEIAAINLESARGRSWSRFLQDPLRAGAAETVLEHEQLTAQFPGDVQALHRLGVLVEKLVQVDAASARTTLIQARVASMMHCFAEARQFLDCASRAGAPPADVKHLLLNIDQACGAGLRKVLDERHEAARTGRMEDLIPLGALLADLCDFAEADRIYREALRANRDVSPFPVAFVYFQLGMLWGELIPEPQPTRAEEWYRKAIDCLPGYTKARVHLAEICSSSGRPGEAEALLLPAAASGDPEVPWRLADVLASQERSAEAEVQLHAARSGFAALLERHLLAFADHGAEFYAGSGDDPRRALELARINVANRPTLRALEQAHEIAVDAGDLQGASELLVEATRRWGGTPAFQSSALAQGYTHEREGAAA